VTWGGTVHPDRLLLSTLPSRLAISQEGGRAEFRVNGRPGRADGVFVTEVDSVRLLASEYNLEFVDLDRFPIDTSAASVLPAQIARQHHVVPVSRKFGAPVIAISDPADVVALDTLRTSIGREFISVVASSGQIEATLDRVYNGTSTTTATQPDPAIAPPPVFEELDDFPLGAMVDVAPPATDHSDPLAVALGDALTRPPPPVAPPTRESAAQAPIPEFPKAASEDDVAKTADLVEEAVAEFEQSSGDAGRETDDSGLASFPPLARALIEGGRVSLADMEGVLQGHNETGQTIARILTARGLVTEADLMWGMANEMGLEYVDLENRQINYSVAYLLPEATARHHNVAVIDMHDNLPVVAASNPTDVFAMDDLRTIIGRNFVTVVCTRSQINAYLDKAYDQGGDAEAVATSAAAEYSSEEDLVGLNAVVEDAPIIRYVNLLILQSLNERASDIHVEPTADNLRIRYRIDGVLHDMSAAPRAIAPAVVTRLKVMADMNIAEHRVPQDGRISLTLGNRSVDLRMATLPTIYGEKVVMRVLDKSNVVLGFEDLGFDDDMLEIYKSIFTKPYGTILVTGPTGSGKTTTLYATLSALNTPEKNIITVEDPVELRIKGINQVQLNQKAGLTFASALRSILRADPDILLVGEIRDRETALVSVEAALTGHLVLATLHTNDAASTPMRLIEMGLEAYLVTSALSAALAQRLARRLCPNCREPYEPTEADIVAAGWRPEEVYMTTETPKVHRAVGCNACSNTGYRGRKALLELLLVTEEVERMIIEGGSADDIHKLATQQGMVTLRQSGLRRALEGETTLEEVLRVVA
jgi:type IV pilus assembly protein PilB